MSNWLESLVKSFLLVCLCVVGGQVPAASAVSPSITGIGRTATPQEVRAWDIDVRPDFKGLPKGAGSVAQGEAIWEASCASCHGTFAESGQVFFPLIGYTSPKDVEAGHVHSLQLGHDAPARTLSMKLSQLSTLWDYINRAMPWTAPKSLKPDEVYAVTAYLLSLANVLPENFVLSDKNMAEVQKRLPNRNGMTTQHTMWPGTEFGGVNGLKPRLRDLDTQGSSCTKNCPVVPKIISFIPGYAMDAHGNLAEQNRLIGAVQGLNTSKVSATPTALPNAVSAVVSEAKDTGAADVKIWKAADVMPILQKNTCTACHGIENKVLGPAFQEIAMKYKARTDKASYLSNKMKSGGSGIWGVIPMPPMAITDAEALMVAQWLSQGAAQ